MRYSIAMAAALLVPTFSSAQDGASSSEEQILVLEEKWAAALLANDLDTVSELMHRDFRLVRSYSDAPPISREMYLGMEGMSASSAEVTSVSITEEAGPVVVARVTWSMDWAQEGVGKLPPHFDMLDTWVKGEDGNWQILSRISQIADGPYRAETDE